MGRDYPSGNASAFTAVAHEADAHEADAEVSDAHEADAQEADAHEADAHEADAHEADAQEALAHEALAHDASAEAADAQLALSKTSRPVVGSVVTNWSSAAFVFGGSATPAAAAPSTIPTPSGNCEPLSAYGCAVTIRAPFT